MKGVGYPEVMAYENVRVSGTTNMFHVKKVSELSELDKEQVRYIMENYDRLIEKFGIKRGG